MCKHEFVTQGGIRSCTRCGVGFLPDGRVIIDREYLSYIHRRKKKPMRKRGSEFDQRAAEPVPKL